MLLSSEEKRFCCTVEQRMQTTLLSLWPFTDTCVTSTCIGVGFGVIESLRCIVEYTHI